LSAAEDYVVANKAEWSGKQTQLGLAPRLLNLSAWHNKLPAMAKPSSMRLRAMPGGRATQGA